MNRLCVHLLLAAALLLFADAAAQAADIRIINNDDPGEGMNNPEPREPVGGNDGTTLGQQRLNALRFAAKLIGARLASNVTIKVAAEFNAQQCSPDNATLASAGAIKLVENFPGARFPDTLYPVALANALAGRDLDSDADIGATFNSAIDDNPLCLQGVDWYYGLDDNPPGNDLNFISTAVHELAHGLGFASFVTLQDDLTTPLQDECGRYFMGSPDIYTHFIRNLPPGPDGRWTQLSRQQRCDSATNDGNVVWDGPSTSSNAAPLFGPDTGTNQGRVQLYAPSSVEAGSSISHWDTELDPNVLMEPFDTGDNDILNGTDITTCLLQDIGWQLTGDLCPDNAGPSAGVTTAPPSSGGSGGGSSGGGGGGGCVLAAGDPLDPSLPLLLLLGLYGLRRRRL